MNIRFPRSMRQISKRRPYLPLRLVCNLKCKRWASTYIWLPFIPRFRHDCGNINSHLLLSPQQQTCLRSPHSGTRRYIPHRRCDARVSRCPPRTSLPFCCHRRRPTVCVAIPWLPTRRPRRRCRNRRAIRPRWNDCGGSDILAADERGQLLSLAPGVQA